VIDVLHRVGTARSLLGGIAGVWGLLGVMSFQVVFGGVIGVERRYGAAV